MSMVDKCRASIVIYCDLQAFRDVTLEVDVSRLPGVFGSINDTFILSAGVGISHSEPASYASLSLGSRSLRSRSPSTS